MFESLVKIQLEFDFKWDLGRDFRVLVKYFLKETKKLLK